MDYKRQTDMFDPATHADRHVTIIGLGNIGSHTAIALAKMGVQNFHVFDFDDVEEHNLASQAFNNTHLKAKKVDAIAEILSHLGVTITTSYQAFRGHEEVKDVLVIAVDSMVERKKIHAQLMESGQNPFVIDGRMGGGQIEVHAQDAKAWGDTFHDNPDSDPCSARYISYTSYIIAGAIANTMKRYLQGERMTKRLLMHVDTWDLITEWHESPVAVLVQKGEKLADAVKDDMASYE